MQVRQHLSQHEAVEDLPLLTVVVLSVIAGPAVAQTQTGPSDDVLPDLPGQARDVAHQAVQFLSDSLDGINTLGQQIGTGLADLLGSSS